MKKRVCAYCRVSTDKDDQKNSLENQESYFKREINKNPDFEFAGIYADEGLSGTKLYRPKFDEMLRDAGLQRVTDEATGKVLDYYVIVDKPKFDIIFVKDISRFARNVSADVLLKALSRNKVHVAFNSTDGTYSTETSSGFSYIQGALHAAEQLSRVISNNVKFGMREGAENGNIFVGHDMYGYKYIPHPENKLEIIKEEAEVVYKIFELYIDGYGSERICNELAKNQMFTRKGKKFCSTTILGMLKNEKYAGLNYGMKIQTGELFGDRRKKVAPEHEQIRFETPKIPAIISREMFYKAQQIRESNTSHKINKGRYLGKTDYAGILVCGKCGTTYQACGVRHLKTRTIRYYACRCRYRFDTDNGIEQCKNPTITQDELDNLLNSTGYSLRRWNRVKSGLIELRKIRSILESRIDKDNDTEIMQLQEQIVDINKKLGKLLDLYLEEDSFSRNELDKRKQPLEKELNDLTEKIKELSKTNEEIYTDIADVDDIIKVFEEENITLQEEFNSGVVRQKLSRKELLKDIDNIVVETDGSLTLNFKSLSIINEIVRKYRFLLDKVS